jgi:hypothetical protein
MIYTLIQSASFQFRDIWENLWKTKIPGFRCRWKVVIIQKKYHVINAIIVIQSQSTSKLKSSFVYVASIPMFIYILTIHVASCGIRSGQPNTVSNVQRIYLLRNTLSFAVQIGTTHLKTERHQINTHCTLIYKYHCSDKIAIEKAPHFRKTQTLLQYKPIKK